VIRREPSAKLIGQSTVSLVFVERALISSRSCARRFSVFPAIAACVFHWQGAAGSTEWWLAWSGREPRSRSDRASPL